MSARSRREPGRSLAAASQLQRHRLRPSPHSVSILQDIRQSTAALKPPSRWSAICYSRKLLHPDNPRLCIVDSIEESLGASFAAPTSLIFRSGRGWQAGWRSQALRVPRKLLRRLCWWGWVVIWRGVRVCVCVRCSLSGSTRDEWSAPT